jgi:hypothetical protein
MEKEAKNAEAGNTVLSDGEEWIRREYYCKNFTEKDYERCGDYMKAQRESKDDYIILKIEYNPMKRTCKFVDKVRLPQKDKINFAVIKVTQKKVTYSEREYKIGEDKAGVKWIKRVSCWNGIFDLPFEGTKINFAWANEWPLGVIESKMWCDADGLKIAKDVLKKTFDEFLMDWKSNGPMEDKENKGRLIDKWSNSKSDL